MRRLLPLLLFALAIPVFAAPEVTALTALRLVPRAAQEEVALIAGYDGQPGPERWHIVVHDAKEAAGVHEYVVAGGELVASRSVSQFAEKLGAQDAIGAAALKVDSDRVVRLTQEYVKANSLPVSTYNYQLKKDGGEAVPLWRVSCLGPAGEQVALLVVTASKGNVVSHDGFAIEPSALIRPIPSFEPTPEPKKTADVKKEKEKDKEKEKAEAKKLAEAKKAHEVREAEPVPTPVAVATPAPAPPPAEEEERKPGLFRRAGGSLQRIFTGR